MSLLESKLNSIAAIAIDAALNNASVDFLTNNYYNKSTLLTILSSKQQNIIQAPATITLGQSADYTYFVDADSKSYPLFSSPDIVWNKQNNNISLNISNEFKSVYLTTTSASSLYAAAEDVANFETAVSLLGDVYQTVTGMSSYVTTEQSSALITGALASVVTSASITNTLGSYLTNANASSTYQPIGSYVTVGSRLFATDYLTTYSPLTGTYLSIIDAQNTYQIAGNYLTNASLFQASGNYVTTLTPLSGTYLSIIDAQNTYQIAGNYLTNASLFQASGNYVTTLTPLSGTYLSIIDAQNTYQIAGNYLTNASLFQASGNYVTTLTPLSGTYLSIIDAQNTYQIAGNYLTNASLFQASGNYVTTLTPLSGTYLSIIGAQNTYQIAGNYLTNASLFQASGNYVTTLTPLSGTYLSILDAGSTYQTIANMINYITSGSLTKASVGLGNVDNTTDLGKPISTATQTALDLKANLASPSFSGTVSIGGTSTSLLYQSRFNIAARFSFNSSNVVTLFYNFGIAPITQSNLVRTGVGVYSITGLNGFIAAGNMAFGGNGFTSGGNRVSTSFPSLDRLNVYLFNSAGTAVDGDVCVFTVP